MSAEEPLAERVPAVADAWFSYVQSNPFAWRMLFQDVTGDPEIRVSGAHRRCEDSEILFRRFGLASGEVPVRLGVDREDLATHLSKEERGDRRGCAAGAVDDDADLHGPDVLEDRLDVIADQVGPRGGHPGVVPCGRRKPAPLERILDFPLLFLVERHPVRIPELDAVVGSRIVGSCDDSPACKVTRPASQRG